MAFERYGCIPQRWRSLLRRKVPTRGFPRGVLLKVGREIHWEVSIGAVVREIRREAHREVPSRSLGRSPPGDVHLEYPRRILIGEVLREVSKQVSHEVPTKLPDPYWGAPEGGFSGVLIGDVPTECEYRALQSKLTQSRRFPAKYIYSSREGKSGTLHHIWHHLFEQII